MRYIIPVKIPNYSVLNSIDIEKRKEVVEPFINSIVNKPDSFEVHEDKYELQKVVYNEFYRYYTIDKLYCYKDAKILRYDFNYDINTFFIVVEADENFNPSGVFYFRAIKTELVDELSTIKIVGIDYIVKGE